MVACFVWPKGALHPFWGESGIQTCESETQRRVAFASEALLFAPV